MCGSRGGECAGGEEGPRERRGGGIGGAGERADAREERWLGSVTRDGKPWEPKLSCSGKFRSRWSAEGGRSQGADDLQWSVRSAALWPAPALLPALTTPRPLSQPLRCPGGARQGCDQGDQRHPQVQLQDQDHDAAAGPRHVPAVPDAGVRHLPRHQAGARAGAHHRARGAGHGEWTREWLVWAGCGRAPVVRLCVRACVRKP